MLTLGRRNAVLELKAQSGLQDDGRLPRGTSPKHERQRSRGIRYIINTHYQRVLSSAWRHTLQHSGSVYVGIGTMFRTDVSRATTRRNDS